MNKNTFLRKLKKRTIVSVCLLAFLRFSLVNVEAITSDRISLKISIDEIQGYETDYGEVKTGDANVYSMAFIGVACGVLGLFFTFRMGKEEKGKHEAK